MYYLDTKDTFEPLINLGNGRLSFPKTKAVRGLRESDGKIHAVTVRQATAEEMARR